MNGWMKVHKVMLAILLIAVALQVVFVFMVVMPRREELAALQGDIALINDRLRGSKWPMDVSRLEAYIEELQQEIDGGGKSALARNSHDAMGRCGLTFAGKIKSEYGNVSDFMRNASRMDYQADYNRIVDAFRKKGTELEPSVLNLSEDIGTQYIYQPLMQLWTVEKLLELAEASSLEVVKDAKGRGRAGVSKVSAKPMKAYFKNEDSERPYLLEFPVEIALVGGLKECLAFIDSLNADGVFLPPVSFEIFAELPGADGGGGRLRMRLVCSSFLGSEKQL